VSRIASKFAALHAAGRKALIPFVTAGDPSLDATVPVMHALVAAGADVIELGVPFPTRWPTARPSSAPERALGRAPACAGCWNMAAFRATMPSPGRADGLLNPVEIHGTERFAIEAVAAGVDGVLLVDLPPEEAADTQAAFTAAGWT
jgi:tryptophan synthase alpha chain